MTVMIEGPYRGKHLRGRTVAQRYAEGERNFRGAILRGANLQGQTLSQADFSGSDLRGANFERAVLQRAYFDQTRGGLQRRWWLAKVLGAIALAAGVGFVPPLLAVPPAAAAVADGDPRSAVGMALVVLCVAIPVVLLARDPLLGGLVRLTSQETAENLVMAAMLCLPFTAMGLIMPLSASEGAASPTAALAQLEPMEIAILALLLLAPLGFAVADGEARQAEWGDLLGIAAVALGGVGGAFAGAEVAIWSSPYLVPVDLALAIASLTAGLTVFGVSFFYRWLGQKVERTSWMRDRGLWLTTIGGTCFAGADLTGASFAGASLKHTRFAPGRSPATTLAQVNWQATQHRQRAWWPPQG